MRRHIEADQHIGIQRHRLTADLHPVGATGIGGVIAGEGSGRTDQLQPDRRIDAADSNIQRLSTGRAAPLEADAVAVRLNDGHVGRTRSAVVAEHDSRLGPAGTWIAVLQAGHFGNDVAVAIHQSAGVIKLIGRAPNIGAATTDSPIAIGVPSRAGQTRRPYVGVTPACRQPRPRGYGHRQKN